MRQDSLTQAITLYHRLIRAGTYNHASGVRLIAAALPAAPVVYEVLVYLALSAGQAVSSTDLSEQLRDGSYRQVVNFSMTLSRLQDMGLLQRTYQGQQGRGGAYYYYLSPLGREVMALAQQRENVCGD